MLLISNLPGNIHNSGNEKDALTHLLQMATLRMQTIQRTLMLLDKLKPQLVYDFSRSIMEGVLGCVRVTIISYK